MTCYSSLQFILLFTHGQVFPNVFLFTNLPMKTKVSQAQSTARIFQFFITKDNYVRTDEFAAIRQQLTTVIAQKDIRNTEYSISWLQKISLEQPVF